MTIDYALLGMLSWKPLSGYDMKRMMQDSPVMYWSGSNNQIYRSLVKLLNQGYVTNKLQYQEGAPDKKIYYLTDSGRAALTDWISGTVPESPEFKKAFLIQLSWAGNLPAGQITGLLDQYEAAILSRLTQHRNKQKEQKYFPNRTPIEQCLWEGIYDNVQMSLETELAWIKDLKEKLKSKEP